MYKTFNSVTKVEIIESEDRASQQVTPIQPNKEKMTNGNTTIAVTGIIAAALTIVTIVALMTNANTKVEAEGKHQDTEVKVQVEKTLPDN